MCVFNRRWKEIVRYPHGRLRGGVFAWTKKRRCIRPVRIYIFHVFFYFRNKNFEILPKKEKVFYFHFLLLFFIFQNKTKKTIEYSCNLFSSLYVFFNEFFFNFSFILFTSFSHYQKRNNRPILFLLFSYLSWRHVNNYANTVNFSIT